MGVIAVPGYGIEGSIAGDLIRIGRPEWVEELAVEFPPEVATALDAADARGESAVVMMDGDAAIAAITISGAVPVIVSWL